MSIMERPLSLTLSFPEPVLSRNPMLVRNVLWTPDKMNKTEVSLSSLPVCLYITSIRHPVPTYRLREVTQKESSNSMSSFKIPPTKAH